VLARQVHYHLSLIPYPQSFLLSFCFLHRVSCLLSGASLGGDLPTSASFVAGISGTYYHVNLCVEIGSC
jgi:ADP-ribosylglycohydrolase